MAEAGQTDMIDNPETNDDNNETNDDAPPAYENKDDTVNADDIPKDNINTDDNGTDNNNSDDDEDEPMMTDEEKAEEVLDIMTEIGDDRDGLDIFQLCAFRAKYQKHLIINTTDDYNNDLEWQYFGTFIRAFITGLTQFVAMIAVTYAQMLDGLDMKPKFCAGEGDVVNRILVFCFSAYISLILLRSVNSIDEQGLYKIAKLDDWTDIDIRYLDFKWVRGGRLINSFVLLVGIWASWLIIFYSDEAIDIILNSLAVFFIVELDDALVDGTDYDQWDEFLENYQKMNHHYLTINDAQFVFYKDPTKMSPQMKINQDTDNKDDMDNKDKDNNDDKSNDEEKKLKVEIPDNENTRELRDKIGAYLKEKIYTDDMKYVDELVGQYQDKKFAEISAELDKYVNDKFDLIQDPKGNDIAIDKSYLTHDIDDDGIDNATFIMCCISCGLSLCATPLVKYSSKMLLPVIRALLKLTIFLSVFVPIVMTICY